MYEHVNLKKREKEKRDKKSLFGHERTYESVVVAALLKIAFCWTFFFFSFLSLWSSLSHTMRHIFFYLSSFSVLFHFLLSSQRIRARYFLIIHFTTKKKSCKYVVPGYLRHWAMHPLHLVKRRCKVVVLRND